jgi:hypothetical protein
LDGSTRFNDLHVLLLGQPGDSDLQQQAPAGWAWQLVTPQPAPPKGARSGLTFDQQQALLQQQQRQLTQQQKQQQAAANLTALSDQQQQQQQQQGELQVPCERADHTMVCWHYCDDGNWKYLLVVFGGSSSSGLLNDVWLFDISTSSWTQVREVFVLSLLLLSGLGVVGGVGCGRTPQIGAAAPQSRSWQCEPACSTQQVDVKGCPADIAHTGEGQPTKWRELADSPRLADSLSTFAALELTVFIAACKSCRHSMEVLHPARAAPVLLPSQGMLCCCTEGRRRPGFCTTCTC